jgi:UDP-sugar diphosphatase
MPIKINSVTPLTNPKYIKTSAINYSIAGQEEEHIWEKVNTHDSVHILAYHKEKNEVFLVSQTRIPVLLNNPDTRHVYECCAGLIDKYPELPLNSRVRKVAAEEVHEELGYKVDEDSLVQLPTIFSSVGSAGANCYLFYVNIDDSMFVGQNLQIGENIKVEPLPVQFILHFITTEKDTDAVTKYLLLHWWVEHKQHNW